MIAMDILTERRAMMQAATSEPEIVLPDTLQRIEYVQRPDGLSNARGYLNLSMYTPDTTAEIKIEIDFLLTSARSGSAGYIIAGGQKTNDNTIGFGIYTPNATTRTQIGCYCGSECLLTPNGGNSILNTRFRVTAIRTPTSQFITDGVNTNSMTLTARNLVRNFALFGLEKYSHGSVAQDAYGKIWSCKIYENGVLKINTIPCRRKSDNRYGIYEAVNNVTAFSSYTTGGPDVT